MHAPVGTEEGTGTFSKLPPPRTQVAAERRSLPAAGTVPSTYLRVAEPDLFWSDPDPESF